MFSNAGPLFPEPSSPTTSSPPSSGTTTSSSELSYGSAITAPAAPEKANSKFTGWSNGTETIQPDDKFNIAGNVTYTAQYENLYNVTYAYEGEIPEGYVPDASTTTTAGATIAAPAVEAPRGYELVWNVTGATENADGSYTAGANDVAFVGTWAKKTTTLSFIFAGDYPEDAEPIAPITVKFGDGDGAAHEPLEVGRPLQGPFQTCGADLEMVAFGDGVFFVQHRV